MPKIIKDFDAITNYKIKANIVRIVGDVNPVDKISRDLAIEIAKENDKDLILLNITNDGVGICKIMELNKFLYERKQKEKHQKQNSKKIKIKELRFTYNTGEHDFNFKLAHAINFLKEGNKVKAFVFFSGRELNYIDLGNIMLLRFIDALSEFGKAEALPKLDGKRLWVMIAPKK
jgi:translation initiation factor IF-3